MGWRKGGAKVADNVEERGNVEVPPSPLPSSLSSEKKEGMQPPTGPRESPGGRAVKSSIARLGATLETSLGEIRGEVGERLARAEAGVEEAERVAERERGAYTESLAFLEAQVAAEREVGRGARREAEEARVALEAAEREGRRAVRRAEEAERAAEEAEKRAEKYAAELAEAEGLAEGLGGGDGGGKEGWSSSSLGGLGKEAVGAALSLRGGLAAKLGALAAERQGLRERVGALEAEVEEEKGRRVAAETELEGRVQALEAMLGMAGDDTRDARDRLAAMDERLREMTDKSRTAADALMAGLAVARQGALAELDDLRRTPVYVRKTAAQTARSPEEPDSTPNKPSP